ncbi:MAG: nitrogen fixation protein NifQ [Sulfuricella sp.]|nr:nitrogen fixation protein NifQ [Sulfuricella sp.]
MNSIAMSNSVHRSDFLSLAGAHYFNAPALDDYFKPAALAITHVMRAADNGDFPLFAATLGIPPKEFAILLDDRSQPVFQFTEIHADLLTDWLPGLFLPLVELLWDYRSCDDRMDWLVSHAIASACFGNRHLWQDLGQPGREDVSNLFSRHFSGLYGRNTQDLKWKRFLFEELGKRLRRPNLKPPACNGCDNYRSCFPSF